MTDTPSHLNADRQANHVHAHVGQRRLVLGQRERRASSRGATESVVCWSRRSSPRPPKRRRPFPLLLVSECRCRRVVHSLARRSGVPARSPRSPARRRDRTARRTGGASRLTFSRARWSWSARGGGCGLWGRAAGGLFFPLSFRPVGAFEPIQNTYSSGTYGMSLFRSAEDGGCYDFYFSDLSYTDLSSSALSLNGTAATNTSSSTTRCVRHDVAHPDLAFRNHTTRNRHTATRPTAPARRRRIVEMAYRI